MSIQAVRIGGGPAMELFVYHPATKVAGKVVLLGTETGDSGGVARRFAEHCAIKFHRKLLLAGIDIPDARRRIADLMGEHWSN